VHVLETESTPREAAPASRVLLAYERLNLVAGHENAGSLSSTHGYLPSRPPLERLDARFAKWDEVARELPLLYRDLRVRPRLDALPILDGSCAALPDEQLLRACALLGMLAHAYWHADCRPASGLPDAIRVPWSQVRARLGRAQPVLSYIDLITYNWKHRQPARPGPLVVEGLELLFPTIGNQEERVFYLTQLEILARTAPVVPLTAAAQAAALQHDDSALMRALNGIAACLRHVVRTSLRKIDPRTRSATYVDPVVWAKTVAPFAVPFARDLQGPSGTSSPVFSTLDIFFGRGRHASQLGREMVALRAGYPAAWRAFLAALAESPVSDYIVQRSNPVLSAAWHEVRDVYIGPDGFLERHRMKVYGYLELAFKVGRSLTIGGFSGAFTARTWDTVDDALRDAHAERFAATPTAQQ
jgi:sulfite reductase (NADPH) flavoprotein alpha-component